MSGLEFKEEQEDFPVTITKKDGTVKKYVIRELKGAGRNQYLTNVTKRFKTDEHGNTFIQDYNGLEASLLTKCMYDAATNKPVTIEEVDNIPATFLSTIFDKAKVLTGLDKEAEAEAKND